MSLIKTIVPAIALSLFAFAPAPASAMTPATPSMALGQAADSMIVDVQQGPRAHRPGARPAPPRYRQPPPRYRQPPRRYRPGGRYDRPPPGWRRYGSRPGYWQRSGCIQVGPAWFCP